MKTTKKLMAGLLCAAAVLPGTTSLAANSWVFSGFSTNNYNIATGIYDKIWYEVDSHGIPTGNEKLDGVAKTVEWRHDFYERDYPHNEVVRLYLDGTKTSVTKDSGALADWETKFEPEMWEVQYPYRIYERLKSNIPGIGWRPNTLEHRGLTQNDLFKYLGKNEPVTQTYEYFGFGPYRIINKDTIASSEYRPGLAQALYNGFYWYDGAKDINGNYIVDSSSLLNRLGIDVSDSLPLNELTVSALSDKNGDGTFKMSNEDISNKIHVFKSEYLVGRDYVNGGKQKIDTATYFTKTEDESMFNANFIKDCTADHPAQISWTNEMNEKEFPYQQYQYLIIDGVICDGSYIGVDADGNKLYLPYLFRYTGGNASPNVEWKYAFVEEAYPHEVYFEKILDGVPTGEYQSFGQRGGKFGTVVYAPTIGELDYKIKSVFGVADYDSDDIFYDGYNYSITLNVDSQIAKTADAALK